MISDLLVLLFNVILMDLKCKNIKKNGNALESASLKHKAWSVQRMPWISLLTAPWLWGGMGVTTDSLSCRMSPYTQGARDKTEVTRPSTVRHSVSHTQCSCSAGDSLPTAVESDAYTPSWQSSPAVKPTWLRPRELCLAGLRFFCWIFSGAI